jgi:large subunit ribosomal protein L14e
MFDIGRVCMKTAGREAGNYCVIVDKSDPGFVLVTGPRSLSKVKRRKCNVHHLEPLVDKLGIKAKATDEEVAKAFKDSGLAGKLGLKERKVTEKPKEHKADKKPAPKKAEPKKEEPKKTTVKDKPAVKREAKKKSKPEKK